MVSRYKIDALDALLYYVIVFIYLLEQLMAAKAMCVQYVKVNLLTRFSGKFRHNFA